MSTQPLHYNDTTRQLKAWIAGVYSTVSAVITGSEVTKTTTGNIDDLDFSNATIIRMNNATDATIRGMLAGVGGQRVTIVSVGAGNVFLAHQNTSDATAANRLINTVTSASTPLVAGQGKATYIYDATTARWRLESHTQGGYITPGFSAGDFTSDVGSWTVGSGDITTMSYEIEADFITVQWAIGTTSVSGTPTALYIGNGQWGGFTAKGPQVLQTSLTFSQGGTFGVGFAQTGTGAGLASNKIFLYQIPIVGWTNATDTTAVYGGLRFQVA